MNYYDPGITDTNLIGRIEIAQAYETTQEYASVPISKDTPRLPEGWHQSDGYTDDPEKKIRTFSRRRNTGKMVYWATYAYRSSDLRYPGMTGFGSPPEFANSFTGPRADSPRAAVQSLLESMLQASVAASKLGG